LVLRVGGVINATKILNSVVCAIAVDVVKLPGRPFAIEMQPRNTVRPPKLPGMPNPDITAFVFGSNNGADAVSLCSGGFFPNKDARFRVVAQCTPDISRSDISGAHE
jgi:hypothetical protein